MDLRRAGERSPARNLRALALGAILLLVLAQPVWAEETAVTPEQEALNAHADALTTRGARSDDYRAMAAQAARRYGVDPAIFLKQIAQESGFNPRARSSAGASGIAQLMPQYHKVDVWDPEVSLDYAAKLMATYLTSYNGDYRLALAAYNAGPGAVSRYGGVPPYGETQHYVRAIVGEGGGGKVAAKVDAPDDDTGAVVRGGRVRHGFRDPAYKAAVGYDHDGVDLEIASGTPVGTPVAGVVVFAGEDDSPGKNGGYGVKIRAADGRDYSVWHLSSTGVNVGDRVKPGQVVGASGQTGNAKYPHVHFQVQDQTGAYQDPAPYLRGHRGGLGVDGDSRDDYRLDAPQVRAGSSDDDGAGPDIGSLTWDPRSPMHRGPSEFTPTQESQRDAFGPYPQVPDAYKPFQRKYWDDPFAILKQTTASPFASLLDPLTSPWTPAARPRGSGAVDGR